MIDNQCCDSKNSKCLYLCGKHAIASARILVQSGRYQIRTGTCKINQEHKIESIVLDFIDDTKYDI